MVRVLRLIPAFHSKSGGPPKVVRGILKNQSSTIRNTVASSNKFFPAKDFILTFDKNNKIILGRILLSFSKYMVTPSLFLRLLFEKVDLVHIHEYRNFQGDIGVIYALLKRIPVVVTLHGSTIMKEGPVLLKVFKKFHDKFIKPIYLRAVSVWMVNSEGEYQDVKSFLKGGNCVIVKILSGINKDITTSVEHVESFKRKHGIGNKVVISYVGRLNERKGVQFIVKALGILKEREIDDFILLFIGPDDGFQKKLEKMVEDLNLVDNVKFLGFQNKTEDQLYAAYGSSNLLVVPSEFENFGHVFLEAAVMKVPILTSAMYSDVFDSKDVISFKYGDYRELAEKIAEYFQDPTPFQEKAKRYYEKVMGMDDWRAITRKYERIYKFLLRKRNSKA